MAISRPTTLCVNTLRSDYVTTVLCATDVSMFKLVIMNMILCDNDGHVKFRDFVA